MLELLVDVVALSKIRCLAPIKGELKYATSENFVGRPLAGYSTDPNAREVCLLEQKTAEALCAVQNNLIRKYNNKYGLMIYDAYRPKRAVLDILHWSKQSPGSDYELLRKNLHYPHIEKKQLFELGYVREDSNHCYANTVDIVLVDPMSGKLYDFGACYDYMDELSHTTMTAEDIGDEAYQLRKLLAAIMQEHGFESIKEEFWHFSYHGKDGRATDEAIDIEITPQLKGLGVSERSLLDPIYRL